MKTEIELKHIAEKIAQIEKEILTTSDKNKLNHLENEMIKLISEHKLNVLDMIAIVEMVQDMLQ